MKQGRFKEEQIIGILKRHEAGQKVADLAREHGISDATIYTWRSRHGGMDLGEAQRLKALDDVVFVSPAGDLSPGIGRVPEACRVQAFIAQFAVETLHVAVPHRLPRLYVYEVDLLVGRPAQDVAASQFRAVVATYARCHPSLLDDPVERSCYPPAAEARIYVQPQTLLA